MQVAIYLVFQDLLSLNTLYYQNKVNVVVVVVTLSNVRATYLKRVPYLLIFIIRGK